MEEALFHVVDSDPVEIDARHFEKGYLEQIVTNSYDSIFVTDSNGTVMLVNKATCRLLGIPAEELIGRCVDDLVREGYYNRSTVREAINTKTVVTGLLISRNGRNLMSTSTPIFDSNGRLILVVTNTRDRDLVEKFMSALEEERLKTARYRSALNYLSKSKGDGRTPIAVDSSMRSILAVCATIAKTDSTVLIQGETGTGKEVVTRYIHARSIRSKEILIPVNCSAIPHELLESEFFGYERGAFTGAGMNGKPGLFEMADKGTLFLDEIAELPIPMQSKLLRVIESGEVQRLGGTRARTTDVRIIAATNKNLEAMVRDGAFRNDLFYRLNVIPVFLPPLRKRKADIPALANGFVEEFNRKYSLGKKLTEQALERLVAYDWPGNIRELRNVIERLVITTEADELCIGSILGKGPECDDTVVAPGIPVKVFPGFLKDVMREVELRYIHAVLDECGGNVSKAASCLGIHRSILHRKLKNALPRD